MNEVLYYEVLKKIPNLQTVNDIGYITDKGIPFKDAHDAIVYVLNNYPGMKPGSDILVHDKVRCKEAAEKIHPEYEKLLADLERMIEENDKELSRMTQEKAALEKQNTLGSSTKAAVLTEYIHEK